MDNTFNNDENENIIDEGYFEFLIENFPNMEFTNNTFENGGVKWEIQINPDFNNNNNENNNNNYMSLYLKRSDDCINEFTVTKYVFVIHPYNSFDYFYAK
eukprot:jgi/Orpsp1_1/1175945/evm.model.c7180000055838.1